MLAVQRNLMSKAPLLAQNETMNNMTTQQNNKTLHTLDKLRFNPFTVQKKRNARLDLIATSRGYDLNWLTTEDQFDEAMYFNPIKWENFNDDFEWYAKGL